MLVIFIIKGGIFEHLARNVVDIGRRRNSSDCNAHKRPVGRRAKEWW